MHVPAVLPAIVLIFICNKNAHLDMLEVEQLVDQLDPSDVVEKNQAMGFTFFAILVTKNAAQIATSSSFIA
ncbi:hypothetical protein Y032_0053g2402 [Ancylostoma ceylanicum]|uniref:Uncharacterized protein n=1 Tax=Ancylostoma ceylanicum TaxID=53326 RepID=A0A016U801_9BILA|nr:hypothetical protein Y032_0053g2402 [Ancylostoma ceylanicum]